MASLPSPRSTARQMRLGGTHEIARQGLLIRHHSGTYRYKFSPVGLTRLSLVGSDPVAARQALATAPAFRAKRGMLGGCWRALTRHSTTGRKDAFSASPRAGAYFHSRPLSSMDTSSCSEGSRRACDVREQ